jgi:hypothetical protein
MSRFEVKIAKEPQAWTLKISGVIDEDARFADFPLQGAPALKIDLNEVKSINSCGIRDWITWLAQAGAIPVELSNCPKVIVDQVNMVQGFLPATGRVLSFYVPYYSEETGNEKLVLFRYGHEFTDQGMQNVPEIIKDDDGSEMEIDVVDSKYFKFIKK